MTIARCFVVAACLFAGAVVPAASGAAGPPPVMPVAPVESPAIVRSTASGYWSDPGTWEGGRVPAAGAVVLVRPGHRVTYDVASDAVIRAVHIGGALAFARDRDTRLCAGLIRIAPGESTPEEGFDCHGSFPATMPQNADAPLLEIGSPDDPIPAAHTAVVRLTYIEGMDKQSFPAVVCCAGGRMELHGAPLERTWVKLAATNENAGDTYLKLAEPVPGWKKGDRILITGTRRQWPGRYPSVSNMQQSEECILERVEDAPGKTTLQLTEPPVNRHEGGPDFAAEVADLSRNLVIESADPTGVRGHTMYHARSAGSISYAEFRHLGKKGLLGRYPVHFHNCGDTLRGSSVVGASIWDSENRCLTIHGTNYLVVRDCVGYHSLGHAFFFEDGTEVYNVLDHNLAAVALRADKLPEQQLEFDQNDGAGFWWANSRNTFTHNVAAECDQHGFRFEVTDDGKFNPVLPVLQPDGTKKDVDIRTLPFVRFDDNEVHTQRRFGINLGGFNGLSELNRYDDAFLQDVNGVGPDGKHPFILRRTRIWDCDWAYHSGTPSVLVEGMRVYRCLYGIWRINGQRQEWNGLEFNDLKASTFYHPRAGRDPLKPGEVDSIDPVDDLPPTTVITFTRRLADGGILVRGVTADNGEVASVTVNGKPAVATRPNFAEWAVTLPASAAASGRLEAGAVDAAGNRELTPHRLSLSGAILATAK